MSETFGCRLRERREQQQIPLGAIAAETKISVSLLEALERDDVSRWPGGIFRRAFIRAYAHAIGLDADVIVREFLEIYPDPVEIVATPSVTPAADAAAGNGKGRVRQLFGSTVAALTRHRHVDGTVDVERVAVVEQEVSDDAVGAPLAARQVDLVAAAELCTRLGQVHELADAAPLLDTASAILRASGVIVWAWQPQAGELTPLLAHGYSQQILAQLPRVPHDAANATAAAFRSARTCVVSGNAQSSGAIVVPVMTARGCVGVLAIELRDGDEHNDSVQALAAIIAAQLATLIGTTRLTETADRRQAQPAF